MQDIKIPGEPVPADTPMLRSLTLVASGLTVASIAVSLILQVAHFARKRPMQPDQRDRLDTAGLTLTVLRQMPGLIKQTRLLISQIRAS